MKDKEVIYYEKNKKIKTLSSVNLKLLNINSRTTSRKRSRYCLHDGINETIHQMLIFHPKNTYVRPHKHLKNIESILIVKGHMLLILYDSNGKIKNKIELSSDKQPKIFYYRISKNIYHSQIFFKPTYFMETTNGPFIKKNTVNAHWSPDEKNLLDVKKFQKKILSH
jgi:cupin fold WbuC family metalloprotein